MIENRIWIAPLRDGISPPADSRHWILCMESGGTTVELCGLGIMTYTKALEIAKELTQADENVVVILRDLSIREYATYLIRGWMLQDE